MVGTSFDTATTTLATKCITHAENEINKWLSKRYNIASFNDTSTSVPPLITSLAETLAEGYIYQRSSRGAKEWMTRGKELITQATDNLKLISEYQLDLVDSNGTVIGDFSNTAYRVLSNTIDYSNTFDEDNELNWAVDSDKLSDIADGRD